MKKWISVLVVLVLALAYIPAIGEEESGISWVEYDYNRLTVGNPTKMTGRFFTALWGNSTSDIDVRQLTAGYNLIRWDGDQSIFRFDHTVVSGAAIGDDQDGNRRYLVSLYNDLHYSDGTRITAWDYAFSVLLQASPMIAELGGTPTDLDWLLGYEDYASGSANGLKGLRVINDRQIVFIAKKEALPYFYELSRMGFNPYPISTIAPGCKVYDSEDGAYIAGEDADASNPFTAELLSETILAQETGYLVHPVPGSGPYTIESFDGETATFTINPWYKGDEDGSKPQIRNLTYTLASNDSMINELGEGRYALLNKVTLSDTIREGLELCTTNGQYTRSTYPRTGLTYFYFLPGSPKVQSGKLRQALAFCLNKTEFLQKYIGYYGLEADGLYGLGQWMYQVATGAMGYPVEEPENGSRITQVEYEEELAKWEEINLEGITRYPFDLEQAAALLNEDGWNLNEQGEAFDPTKDTVRYKQTDAGLQPLELKIAYTTAAEAERPLTACFLDNLTKAGIKASLIPAALSRIEEVYEGTADEDYDMLYLGNNFSFVFNPKVIFSKAMEKNETAPDSIPAVHAEMYELAQEMDRTEPTDPLSYMQKWVAFQERLSETLPIIPVYINVYFDFYTRELHDYWITNHSTWADAIIAARMFRDETDEDDGMEELLEDYGHITNNDTAQSASDFSITYQAKSEPDASAGALANYPKSVQEQIPQEYRTINEFITASISDDYQNIKSATIEFAFETKYPAGETAYLIFGVLDGDQTEWFVRPAKALDNGAVSVELDVDQLNKLSGQQFPLVVVSKE